MATAFKAPAKRKESNVWQITKGREAGRWGWEVELRRQDGSTYRKAGTRKTEKDALKARDRAFDEFNQSEGKVTTKHTVKTWCEYCLNDVFPHDRKPTTVQTYKYWLKNYVYEELGHMPLNRLSTQLMQQFFNGIQESKPDMFVAEKTKVALSACLTRAMQEGVITHHPVRYVSLKKASVRHVDEEPEERVESKTILNAKQQTDLLTAAKGTDIYLAILLGLKLGMRFGECLGLEWKDVDLDRRVVRVVQQVQRHYGKGVHIQSPKTPHSIRNLPIPASVLPILSEAKEKATKTGMRWVCPNRAGKPTTAQLASTKLKKIAKLAGLAGKEGKPDVKHHDLRSTFLSFLANEANDGLGVRPSVLMRLAGHSKIDTTMKFYVRASDEDLERAMSFIT